MMGSGNKNSGEILVWYLYKNNNKSSDQYISRQVCSVTFDIRKISCCDIHPSCRFIAFSQGIYFIY